MLSIIINNRKFAVIIYYNTGTGHIKRECNAEGDIKTNVCPAYELTPIPLAHQRISYEENPAYEENRQRFN